MTIHDMLKEKSITKYSLSKKSGIDWEILSDICSGKIPIATCSVDILQKLALAVGISMDDILLLEDGKPEDSSYLEMNLSLHLSKSIEEYVLGKKIRYPTWIACGENSMDLSMQIFGRE